MHVVRRIWRHRRGHWDAVFEVLSNEWGLAAKVSCFPPSEGYAGEVVLLAQVGPVTAYVVYWWTSTARRGAG